MSDPSHLPPPAEPTHLSATPQPEAPDDEQPLAREAAVDPQKLLRIAGVTREVLEEARRIRPEPGAVEHLRQVHARITDELRDSLPEPLYQELDDLTPDPDPKGSSLEELGLAHAEILGWLEGLFQGTQLAIQLQAAHAAAQLQDRMRRPLPAPDSDDRSDSRYL